MSPLDLIKRDSSSIHCLPERILEADQREVLDHLTFLLQIAEEHAIEHRTAQSEHKLVAVHRLALDEETHIAELRVVEQRSGLISRVEWFQNGCSIHSASRIRARIQFNSIF